VPVVLLVIAPGHEAAGTAHPLMAFGVRTAPLSLPCETRTPNLTHQDAKLMNILKAEVLSWRCSSRGQRKRDPLGRVPVVRFCGAGPRGGCDWPLTHLHAVGAWVQFPPYRNLSHHPGAETSLALVSTRCRMRCSAPIDSRCLLSSSVVCIPRSITLSRMPSAASIAACFSIRPPFSSASKPKGHSTAQPGDRSRAWFR
jgi:hypothetical protein